MEHKILYALREIKKWQVAGCPSEIPSGRPFGASLGLCEMTARVVSQKGLRGVRHQNASDFLQPAFLSWPENPGGPTFPVPSKRGCRDSAAAKYKFMTTGDLWEGEYGELRIELLDHCIAHFEAECAK